MTSDRQVRRLLQGISALILLCVGTGAVSAPRFITGSRVEQDKAYVVVTLQFACGVEYVDHLPANEGDQLRIQLQATSICRGASPSVARSRELHRPLDADEARLLEIDYDGDSGTGQILTLVFRETVRFDVLHDAASDKLTVRIYFKPQPAAVPRNRGAVSNAVTRPSEDRPAYVINLSSSRVPHSQSEFAAVAPSPGLKTFETEVVLGGITWYRLRVGHFENSGEASLELQRLSGRYPTAWVDRAKSADADPAVRVADETGSDVPAYEPMSTPVSLGLDQVDRLMSEARQAMVAGQVSRAVQIYTKVLRAPHHDRHAEALEYLALAREKNGQLAHAKAEYQRYLSLYPGSDGADRVNQRLAALLASDRQLGLSQATSRAKPSDGPKPRSSDWRMQAFLSQYYRRDVNQFSEQDDIVSQSALYSDVNLDVRRRGQRFDFSSRLSAGYRRDFLDEGEGTGDDIRVSYAFVDLAHPGSGLRGRIGRQTRNTDGVLGRFDGLNLSYRASDRVSVNTVLGKPVYSASEGIDTARTFHGASINYGPVLENLNIGLYYIRQNIEGLDDRRAVGTEFRYLGENQSLWGLIDYDLYYEDVGGAFLQGSWRLASRLTIHGSIDQRHSPFLSTGNALIGQPVEAFSDLLILWTEEEIRQLALDRTPRSDTYTVGISHSLTPRLQFNVDANQTTIDATPQSGGVAATPQTTYKYYAANLTASSLIKEGDVTIIGLRYTMSDSTKSTALHLDTRIPFGRFLRINPRLRIERREILSDSSNEWSYTPGIRIQFRWSQKLRIELEAGKLISQRDMTGVDWDRESYFINLGYQAFF